jgi:hypothetical protein
MLLWTRCMLLWPWRLYCLLAAVVATEHTQSTQSMVWADAGRAIEAASAEPFRGNTTTTIIQHLSTHSVTEQSHTQHTAHVVRTHPSSMLHHSTHPCCFHCGDQMPCACRRGACCWVLGGCGGPHMLPSAAVAQQQRRKS